LRSTPSILAASSGGEENATLDLFLQLAKGLQVDRYELFQFEEGMPATQMHRGVERLIAEIEAEDLPRVGLLEALIHRV
jgi:hypothetical protein